MVHGSWFRVNLRLMINGSGLMVQAYREGVLRVEFSVKVF